MHPNNRKTSAPMLTHPCPACGRLTRQDGYCRTRNCPNRVPDELVAPAREQALADMRAALARSPYTRKETPDD